MKTTNKWEEELRINLDDIFEDAHSYTGPNIDETFDMVFKYCKSFISTLLLHHNKELIEKIKGMKEKRYIQTDIKIVKCPLNPPNKDFKHIISKTGIKAQCYQCGHSYRSPDIYGKNEVLSDILSLLGEKE